MNNNNRPDKELVKMIEKEIGTYSTDLTKSIANRIATKVQSHYEDRWVKVEDKTPQHRKTVWMVVKEFPYYPIRGYYNKIIDVFHAYNNPEFNGHKHTVTDWQYEKEPILPSPPKE